MEQQALLKKRVDSIDILRGGIMMLMALDHVRDFFHAGAMTSDPTDPATTTPIVFFTRFITHYCAPVFVFLAGTAAFLSGRRKTKKEQSVFLLKRGLWLILLEVAVFNLLFSFDPLYHFLGLQVIWVTGVSMILLAAFIYLPVNVLFVIGLVMVVGHNMLDSLNTADMEKRSLWWGLLHQQYFVQYAPGRFFGVLYPLIPWPGIMLLGYCMGSLFAPGYAEGKRRRKLIGFGLTATLAFFLVRWLNAYGDPVIWTGQKNSTATVLSFFNVSKYPPSFLYCCITLGPALILLAGLEKVKSKWTDIVVVYGRVPLFYYLLHFFLLHLLCTIAFFASGYTLSQAATGMMLFRPNDFGYSLGVVYLIWIAVVAILYPFCKRYSQYKVTHDQWWLSYL